MKKNILVFVMFVGVQFVFGQVEKILSNDFAFDFEHDTIKKKGKAIEEVVIIKKIQKGAVTAGKLPIKALDLPQAVAIIDRTTLEQQQILRISDALWMAEYPLMVSMLLEIIRKNMVPEALHLVVETRLKTAFVLMVH